MVFRTICKNELVIIVTCIWGYMSRASDFLYPKLNLDLFEKYVAVSVMGREDPFMRIGVVICF